MDTVLQRFGSIHKSVHGDGRECLQRILTTCEEMLRDRGCDLGVVRADDPWAVLEAGGTTPVMQGRGPDLCVDVYVHGEEKVGVKFARTILEACEDENVHVVVVSPQGATPFTKRECEGKPIQFFLARNLCVNVTKHQLVPKHERVEPSTLPWPVERLPRIYDFDPIVQYHNWPLGTVVRVSRCFGGHEPVPYFRVVVSAASS